MKLTLVHLSYGHCLVLFLLGAFFPLNANILEKAIKVIFWLRYINLNIFATYQY